MKLETLYAYYEHQAIAPTFANLRDETSMVAYQTARTALLSERLRIPIPLLREARIVEFGPDTGENALTFARLGARMTLVEPAVAVHSQIQAYFNQFAPPGALQGLVAADVLSFDAQQQRYDMIVAEGFIYTVKPTTAWLDAFTRVLVPGGLALVSYLERSASLFELLLKVPFAVLRRRTQADRLSVAERLYRPKWDAIPHTRSFESWVMDVLNNPFVRLEYFIDAGQLARDAASRGFGFHCTWPSYSDGLENTWAKRPSTSAETLDRTERHLTRSVLTFILGTKAYLVEIADAERIVALVTAALSEADALIDADDVDRSRRLAGTLRELATAARNARTIVDSPTAFSNGVALIDAWADIVDGLRGADVAASVARLREDPILVDGWGTPTHLAVLRMDRPR